MVVMAQTLGSKSTGPRVQAAHLLGTAIGAKSDWHLLASAVEDAVYNCHSTYDNVLKIAYPVTQGGQSAAGLKGSKRMGTFWDACSPFSMTFS